MNKSELIERIIDTFTDMGSEDPVDIAYCNLLTLPEAKMYLDELRANEKANLESEEWLPAEITPELYMEAYNCYIRRCQYEVTRDRLEYFIEHNEMVLLFHEFDGEYISYTDKVVYPTYFLMEDIEFPFAPEDYSMLDLIRLGQNSKDFSPDCRFCWYDMVNDQLHSTNTPIEDGLMNARDFAEWLLSDDERISYVKEFCTKVMPIDYVETKNNMEYVFEYWRY